MRLRDESIRSRNFVSPSLENDIIADKYPEEKPAIKEIDATEIVIAHQRPLIKLGFGLPLLLRKKTSLQKRIAARKSRDILTGSQHPEFIEILPIEKKLLIGMPMIKKRILPSGPMITGSERVPDPVVSRGPTAAVAAAPGMNWLDRFFAWINRALGSK